MMDVDAKWFRVLLKAMGRSQADLARALGIGPSAVSRVMKDNRQWQSREIPLVAQFLNVSIEDVHRHSGKREADAVSRLSHPISKNQESKFDPEMMANVIESVLALLSKMEVLQLEPPAREVIPVFVLTYEEAMDQEGDEPPPDLTEIASNILKFEARRRVFRPMSSPGESHSGENIKA